MNVYDMKNEIDRLSDRLAKLEADRIGSQVAAVCLKHVILRNGGLTDQQWDAITNSMIESYTAMSERESSLMMKACFAQVAEYIRQVNEMAKPKDGTPFFTIIEGGKA